MHLKMRSISTPTLLLSESAPYTILHLLKSDYCSKLLLDIYPDHIKLQCRAAGNRWPNSYINSL